MSGQELAISITSANGTVVRWGGDEPDGRNLPSGLQFSTSMPGGFKDLTVALPRDLRADYPDQRLYDDVRVYGPGNQTAWEGRMASFPASIDDTSSVQPAAIGWAAHLRDDPSFREIYVDRDLSRWGNPSAQRVLDASPSFRAEGPSVVGDAGLPALSCAHVGAWGATTQLLVEAFYDSQRVPIGSIFYAWRRFTSIDNADPNWAWDILASDNDRLITIDSSGSLRAAGPATGTLTASAGRFFAAARLLYSGAAGAANVEYALHWTCLAVYGRHGLTKQGTASATAAEGFYASDVIAHIVSRSAPLLTYTTGTDGSIQPTTFNIEQLAFREPTTGEDAISTVNAYHLWEWGVWENRQFFFREPTASTVWEARLSEGARIQFEGDDANNIYNGVIVQYTDPSGQARVVGPTGAVANDTSPDLLDTSPDLLDTSEDNPVNAHGIPRRWGFLQLSNPATLAGATQLGKVWLAEHTQASRRGSITFTGTATHPTRGSVPCWQVRAGDYVRVSDNPTDVPRRIIETRYDHDARTLTCSVDNTLFRIDSIVERLGLSLGLSGI